MKVLSCIIVFTFFIGYVAAVEAQSVGNRTLGRPLNRRARPDSASVGTVGQIRGSERFLRGNRGIADFVGADQSEATGFVGMEQGRVSGQVVSSIGGLLEKVDLTRLINRPIEPLSKEALYPPRLILSSDFPVPQASNRIDEIADSLNWSLNSLSATRIAVSVVKRKAILRGEVVSARERDLAEILLLFEPGIDSVQNDLILNPPEPAPAAPRNSRLNY